MHAALLWNWLTTSPGEGLTTKDFRPDADRATHVRPLPRNYAPTGRWGLPGAPKKCENRERVGALRHVGGFRQGLTSGCPLQNPPSKPPFKTSPSKPPA